MSDEERRPDDSLAAEAIDQLHHLDDRRDAAEMRVEELVRDTVYEKRSHREDSRANLLLILAIATAIVAAGLVYLWLRSMCL